MDVSICFSNAEVDRSLILDIADYFDAKNGDDYTAYAGVCFLKAGAYEKAVSRFNQVEKSNNNYHFLYQYRARAYMKLNRWPDAVDDLESSLARGLGDFRDNILLSKSLYEISGCDKAEGHLERVLEINGSDNYVFDGVIRFSPDKAEAFVYLANLYLACGKENEGKKALLYALNFDNSSPVLFDAIVEFVYGGDVTLLPDDILNLCKTSHINSKYCGLND